MNERLRSSVLAWLTLFVGQSVWLDAQPSNVTFEHLSVKEGPPQPNRHDYGITEREHTLLQLITQGYTYRMIGIQRSISVETVRQHLKNSCQKLPVQCGTEAVARPLQE